mgnify:FL=1
MSRRHERCFFFIFPFLPGPQALEDPLCRVVLVEPLIPENTGNVSRTCVGLGAELHLVEPMGFEITESRVKRAGLDYWSHLSLQIHPDFSSWRMQPKAPERVFYVETSGEKSIFDVEFQRGDWIVFGKETSGLTPEQMAGGTAVSIPMTGPIRSLNLSNAVAITVFELFRQVSAAPS